MDKWGDEWNEYMDKLSCEYFYWMEEDNVYQWMKPPLPQRKVPGSGGGITYFKPGDEFLFR